MAYSPLILAHLYAAVAAVLIGGLMFVSKKGTLAHRLSGRLWVVFMLLAALISFGIRSKGHFSWIHLLSVVTLAVIGMAVISIYRRNIGAHKRWMTGAYVGLVTAGLFALMPDRRLGYLVWHTFNLI
jgi:uncharacterized membrane protein